MTNLKKASEFTVGQKVQCNGYPGTIVRHYSDYSVEVRLGSGLVCVDVNDLNK